MRLNINLASQKYEDVRWFVSRARIATGVMVAFTMLLAVLAWFNYSNSKNSSARIRELQQKISALQQQRAAAEMVENRPENRDVTEQKNFWNRQIARRAFSWTQLFNDLQRIMPGRAYVISVSPELTPENRVKLKLTIGGEKYENVLELVKKMEGSQRFRLPKIDTESVQTEGRPGSPQLHKFEIETFYTPAGGAQVRTGSAREGF
jgi:Tfp pilus assembly protein PilN